MGLKEILDEISKESDERTLSILNDSKVKAAQITMQKTEELEAYYKKKRDAFVVEMEREERKLFAKVELDAQKALNIVDNQIIESTISEVFQEIIDRLKKDEGLYLTFLQKHIEQAAKILKKKEIQISLNNDDTHLFEKLQSRVKTKIVLGEPAMIRAGIICSATDTPVFIDSSMGSILRDLKPEFIRLITQELSKE
jgi:vacuolar-type H+-ATPase subunit E/Vma4